MPQFPVGSHLPKYLEFIEFVLALLSTDRRSLGQIFRGTTYLRSQITKTTCLEKAFFHDRTVGLWWQTLLYMQHSKSYFSFIPCSRAAPNSPAHTLSATGCPYQMRHRTLQFPVIWRFPWLQPPSTPWTKWFLNSWNSSPIDFHILVLSYIILWLLMSIPLYFCVNNSRQ